MQFSCLLLTSAMMGAVMLSDVTALFDVFFERNKHQNLMSALYMRRAQGSAD